MKLQNILPHMIGQAVNVNGTPYQLNAKGIVEVTNEKDIAKLLADRSAWRVYVEREPIVKPAIVPEPVKPIVEAVVNPPEDLGDQIPDEWPDPTMAMSIKQLHEIADAYQVQYTSKTSKKALVDAIMVAMYGEE